MQSVVDSPPPGAPASAERPLDELEREICELAANIAAAMCRWLLLLAEWDRRGGWAEWGCRSCAQWLSWRCSITPGSARERMRVARALPELPLIREAFLAGELSYSKVRAITRVAGPDTEAVLVNLARHATGFQLEKLVRGYRGVLSATADGARSALDRRHVGWCWEDDGSLSLRARLPAEDGALLLSAIQAAAPAHDVVRLADHRMADGLAEVARSALAAGDAPRAGGDPCELVVHVDAATLASDEVQERCEVADGPAVSPETVRRLGCDSGVVRMVERDGQPLSVGRRTRTVTAALRRALRSRDRGCRFPGCTHQRFLHAHHIRHWARGGPTSLDNLVQLCSYHHRLVHEGGFAVETDDRHGARFRRPDGHVIAADGSRGRACGPPLSAQMRADGVEVDAHTCRAKSAGDTLDYSIAVDVLVSHARLGGRSGEVDGGGDGDGEGDAGVAVIALQEEDEHGHGAGEDGDEPGEACEIHTPILTGGEDAHLDEPDPLWTPEDLLWIDAPG